MGLEVGELVEVAAELGGDLDDPVIEVGESEVEDGLVANEEVLGSEIGGQLVQEVEGISFVAVEGGLVVGFTGLVSEALGDLLHEVAQDALEHLDGGLLLDVLSVEAWLVRLVGQVLWNGARLGELEVAIDQVREVREVKPESDVSSAEPGSEVLGIDLFVTNLADLYN